MKRTISEDASQVAQDLRRSGRLSMVQQMPNPYAVLGVAIGEQDPAVIRRAFLKAVRTYAPQSHPTEFVCIVEAYEMLRDPVRRTALEGSLVEVSPGAGKHRRLGGLTPQSAAAFLKARDGPMLILDQQGRGHTTVAEPPANGAVHVAAASAAASGATAATGLAGSASSAGRAASAEAASSPQAREAAKPAPPESAPRHSDSDMEEPLFRTESVMVRTESAMGRTESVVMDRTESVGSAMHLETLDRTASVSSAMSL